MPHDLPEPDNDLNEKLDQSVQRAMADEKAWVYAFGERWGPESRADKYFGFIPGNGIHDVHMNQGNVGSFVQDDGVRQALHARAGQSAGMDHRFLDASMRLDHEIA